MIKTHSSFSDKEVIVASGPVIIEKGKVLLDKHGEDKFWKFPGSSIEEGESLEECAKKRAKEELGIGIEIIKPLKPVIIWQEDKTVILIHYLAKRKGEINPADYVREWKWIDIKKLPKDIAPNIKMVLKEIAHS
jgi:ADP-ribose pyrophosphatase YjhB (NUDIX family)